MYMSVVFPFVGSVTFASRPHHFCDCCLQAVGLLLYVAPPMSWSDLCKYSQYYALCKVSNPSIDPYRSKDWVAVVVRVSAPALAICRVSACRSPVPRTDAGMCPCVEWSGWHRHGIDIGEGGRRKHSKRSELLEVGHW